MAKNPDDSLELNTAQEHISVMSEPAVPMEPCTCDNCPHMEKAEENKCCQMEHKWKKEYNSSGKIYCST